MMLATPPLSTKLNVLHHLTRDPVLACASYRLPVNLANRHVEASLFRRRISTSLFCNQDDTSSSSISESEREGWERRKKESAEASEDEPDVDASVDGWKWTLNWSSVTDQLIIGSCPRSASDVDRLMDEAGVTAIVNLQSDVCFEALEIPAAEIRERAVQRGLYWERIPTLDFDRGDQALMLPAAVRKINLLLQRGQRVYCHCTAGINRASLAVLGYLTFVEGVTVKEGLARIKAVRPIANPYMDSWTEVHRRLLDGRQEEVTATAVEIYENRCAGGIHGNAASDWASAQAAVVARTFTRWLEVDQLALSMNEDILRRTLAREAAAAQPELDSTVEVRNVEAEKWETVVAVLQAQLAESQDQARELQSFLSMSQKQLAESQSNLSMAQNQLAASQANLAATLKELAGVQAELLGLQAASLVCPEPSYQPQSDDVECDVITRTCGQSSDAVGDVEATVTVVAEELESSDDLECDVITRTCKESGAETLPDGVSNGVAFN